MPKIGLKLNFPKKFSSCLILNILMLLMLKKSFIILCNFRLISYHWATFRRLFLIYSQEFSTGDHIFLAQFFMKFLVVQVLFFLKLPENWPFLLIKISKKLSKNVGFSAWNFLHQIFVLDYNFFITKSFLWNNENTNSKGFKIIKIAGLTSVEHWTT